MTRIDPSRWTGRDDGPGAQHARWHSIIRPYGESTATGAVIIGFASDEGVRRNGGRIGAADGPEALRKALAPLAIHDDLNRYDAGTVVVDSTDLETAQAELGAAVAEAIRAGHFPVVLGGGHEVAYASYLGLNTGLDPDRQRTLGVLNLDAHFDLRAADRPTSGTGFAQIAESERQHGREVQYRVVGISRSANTRTLFERAEQMDARYLFDDECRIDRLSQVLDFVDDHLNSVDDLYLTIDLDVLPAAVAPGVSAPASLGVVPEVIQAVVDRVASSGKLRIADIAELNPRFDIDGRTARIGARLIDRIISQRNCT